MPRVPLVDEDTLPESYDILQKKEDKLPEYVDATFWNRQPTVRAFSNNPELGKAHVTTNSFLWAETGFSGTQEELIILTVANEFECRLLWHDHVMIALENDRLSKAEILAIAAGDFTGFDEGLQAIGQYVLEFIENHGKVSDDVYDAIAAEHDDAFIISIGKLTGFYIALSHEVNAVELDRDPFVGWDVDNVDNATPP